jgi:hypothetical protein
MIAEWVQRKYQRVWGIDLIFDLTEITLSPLTQHSLIVNLQESDDFRHVLFEWTHPDDQDKTMLWKTSLILCGDNEKIEFSITVRIESTQFLVKPVTGYNFGRPGIVDAVLNEYKCLIMGEEIPTNYARITSSDEVELFVNNMLENSDRVLPVVLLSKDVWTDTTFVEAVTEHPIMCQ